jgi:NADPH:quinone reductase-like Zn-dependent oxidoreductase
LKAVTIHQHGGVDQLRYEHFADPELTSPNDVIVKLHAAALNHIDLRLRRGLCRTKIPLPRILGLDGAGVVTATGSAVKNVKIGEAVCLYPVIGCGGCENCVADREFMCTRPNANTESTHGTYAEYIRVPARNCFPSPAGLSFAEAAAFPLVFLTVWRMLITNAELKPGETILILGIGGGVASAALQVASMLRARAIVTSSSDEKLLRAKQLSAEHGINYRNSDFPKEVRSYTGKRGVDVVVDCVGGESWAKSLEALAKGGRLTTCGATTGHTPPTNLQRIFWNDLSIFGSSSGSRAEFQKVLDFISVTGCKPIIDRIFPLNEAAQAHQRLEADKQFGKIVLRISD